MSRPINEEAPLSGIVIGDASIRHPHSTCATNCGECDTCVTRIVDHAKACPLKSRAEFYQVAIREEGEAKLKLHEAQQNLRIAQEAYNDASAQLTLTRNGLFKACGL